MKHRQRRGDHHPQPTPLSLSVVVNRSGADLNAEHLIEQAPHLAMAEMVDIALKAYQSAELRANASSLHSLWHLRAGYRMAMRANQPCS
jgi:hypothetical protein